jgi:hypothetical protein
MGQHDTDHSVILVVPDLFLRHEHGPIRPRARLVRLKLQDHLIPSAISLSLSLSLSMSHPSLGPPSLV